MLQLYNYLDSVLEERNKHKWFFENRLIFFMSEIIEELEINDPVETEIALNRVFEACCSLHIPIEKNFKQVFRVNENEIINDWKLSPLATYMIIINCSPCYERVALAQLYFAMNATNKNQQHA
jgi:hypothetical protein